MPYRKLDTSRLESLVKDFKTTRRELKQKLGNYVEAEIEEKRQIKKTCILPAGLRASSFSQRVPPLQPRSLVVLADQNLTAEATSPAAQPAAAVRFPPAARDLHHRGNNN